MPVVNHTLTRPGGGAMADEIVHIRLLAAATGEAEGFVASTQSGILSEYKLRTDSTGTWSVTLTANALITPANTTYQVIQPGITGGKVTETFIVPNGAGPYWLGDILAAPPAGLPGTALAAHDTSATAHTGTFVRLPAGGANNNVLTKDSAEALGVKWGSGVPITATQGGTPLNTTPLRVMTLTGSGTTAPVFAHTIGTTPFGGTDDTVSYWGWNVREGGNRINTARPRWSFQLEEDFNDGGVHWSEGYLEWQPAVGVGSYTIRPFFFGIRHDGANANAALVRSWVLGNPFQIRTSDDVSVASFSAAGGVFSAGAALDATWDFRVDTGRTAAMRLTVAGASVFQVSSPGPSATIQQNGFTCGRILGDSRGPSWHFTIGATNGLGVVSVVNPGTHVYGMHIAQRATPVEISLVVTDSTFAQKWWQITKNGYMAVGKTAAPADAELAANEMALWFDSTNGAAKLMIKAKEASGTVRTGSVALA